MKRWLFLLSAALISVFALTAVRVGATGCVTDIEGKSDAELEKLLAACEAEIAEEKAELANVQREATSIEADIQRLNYQIRTSELEINKRNIEIALLGDEIVDRARRIGDFEERIIRSKDSLSELLRKSNESGSRSAVEAILSGESLSTFFANVDDFEVVKSELQATILAVREVKGETETEKASLEEDQEAERLLHYQEQQAKAKTEKYKAEQDRLLALTESEINRYQDDIAGKERVKNEIRNRIFRTVGGHELRFEDALKLVRQIESIVGINPALVLAVLTQETGVSGVIGANIGQCNYNTPANNKSGTVMSDSQKENFLKIIGDLNLDPNKVPVSCPIVIDGAYGGAMGIAQFMPNTWVGYRGKVAKALGISDPSPFEPLDAFTGTALYLRQALDRCLTAFSSTFELRACSAAKYYSGLASKGSRLARHMNPRHSYGYKVAQRAAQFARDIELLDL